jgi:hypothetical protein
MPGELAAIFRSLADDTSEAAGSIATALGRFTVATADTEDANVARTLTAEADTTRAVQAIQPAAGPATGGWSGAGHVEASTPEAEAAYAAIRANPADVTRVAANTGISEDIIARIKTHLFLTEHDVAVGPGELVRGYFTARPDIAKLWAKAEAGTLDASEQAEFRSLMSHEYVESRLMEAGMPYRSAAPAAWDGEDQVFTRRAFGAHDVAPIATEGTLRQWRSLGLTPPSTPIAPDLSNIEDIVAAAREGLGL